MVIVCFFQGSGDKRGHTELHHAFPTRRASDLAGDRMARTGAGALARGDGFDAGNHARRRTILDSRHPGGMEGPMVPDMTPPAAAADFLAAHGWGDAEIAPLAGDASFRR